MKTNMQEKLACEPFAEKIRNAVLLFCPAKNLPRRLEQPAPALAAR